MDIPKLTEQPVQLKDDAAKNFEAWMHYFKNLHPRVQVHTIADEDFFKFLEQYFQEVTTLLDKQSEFLKMKGEIVRPDAHIVIVVLFDHSLDDTKTDYSMHESIVLCSGKKAWITDWGVFGIEIHHPRKASGPQLLSYQPIIRSWGYATKYFVDRLKRCIEDYAIPALSRKKPGL